MQQPVQHSELDQIIITCQSQANQTYGYRRVLRWMERNNTKLYNASMILRHMRKLDLLAQIRRRRPDTLYKQGGHRSETGMTFIASSKYRRACAQQPTPLMFSGRVW